MTSSAGHLPTRNLLDRWDEHVRADRSFGQRLIAPAEARGTVLRAPASEAQLAAAEQRLGVDLPPSYRAFLAFTDGADASGPGPVLDMERPEAGLLPVDEVEWAVLAEPFLVDLWTELTDLPNGYRPPQPTDDPVPVEEYEPMRRALLVGGRQSRPGVFLVPVPGQDDWQVWILHHEGAQAYRSMTDLLRWTADQPLPGPPTSEEIDAMVVAIRGGDLTDLGPPPITAGTAVPDRLVEVAIEILADDEILFGPLPSWARLADDPVDILRRERDLRAASVIAASGRSDAIPVLRRALGVATRTDSKMGLLGALVDCGAPDARRLLLEATTDDDPQLRRYAVSALGRREDV